MRPSPDAQEPVAVGSAAPVTVAYVDADGAPTLDPALAVRGEIVEYDVGGMPVKRTWFLQSRADLSWLPVTESAFLLWVLGVLVAAWLGVGIVLYVL